MNYTLLLKIAIIILCISPTPFLGDDQRNYLLIAAMGISPLLQLTRPCIYPKYDLPVCCICLSLIAFPLLFHPETMRWSTVLFSCMFFIFFLTVIRLFKWSLLEKEDFANLLKWLIYAYTVVLMIQQFCVLTGLPIFNVNAYTPAEPWKLNSLSSEPSHTARFMAILMYSYLWLQDLISEEKISFAESFKAHKLVWMSFLWTMLTCGSGTAIFMVVIIFLKYFKTRHIVIGAFAFALIAIAASRIQYRPVKRAYTFTSAVLTGDKSKMIKADMSAALRVVPLMMCFEETDLSTKDGWTGKGIDYGKRTMSRKLTGVIKGYTSGGYGLLLLEYGFINFLLVCAFMIYTVFNPKQKLQSILLWFFCCFFIGLNTQIGWAFTTFSALIKQYGHEENIG